MSFSWGIKAKKHQVKIPNRSCKASYCYDHRPNAKTNNQTQRKTTKFKVFPMGSQKGKNIKQKPQIDPVGIVPYVRMKYKHQKIDPVRRRTIPKHQRHYMLIIPYNPSSLIQNQLSDSLTCT